MIITLCGSARFEEWFHVWNEALSLSGHVVFGLGAWPSRHEGKRDWYTQEEKRVLDDVHLQKITTAHAVMFLNVFAYMGESSLREFKFAQANRRPIYFLESWGEGRGIGSAHTEAVRERASRYVTLPTASPIDTSRFPGPWNLLPAAGSLRTRIVNRLEGWL